MGEPHVARVSPHHDGTRGPEVAYGRAVDQMLTAFHAYDFFGYLLCGGLLRAGADWAFEGGSCGPSASSQRPSPRQRAYPHPRGTTMQIGCASPQRDRSPADERWECSVAMVNPVGRSRSSV